MRSSHKRRQSVTFSEGYLPKAIPFQQQQTYLFCDSLPSLKDLPKLNPSLSCVQSVLESMGMHPFCAIKTRRRKYQTDDGLGIDLDSLMEMNYHIGEVELMVSQQNVQEASKKILNFIQTHKLDIEGPIYGKVLYYIKQHNREQFEILHQVGLIDRKLK